jgi:cytochrome c-type biogenesis protein
MIALALIPAAFLAGVLMFLAPCTLPMVPGFLAFIAGVPPGEEDKKSARGRVVRNALAYVVGFSIIYILLGVAAGSLGGLLGPWKDTISRAAGIIIILFGLTMLGLLRIPILSSERRIRIPKFLTIGKVESSFLIGVLFALGWSPCIGPILGTILSLSSSALSTALQGALLLAVFSFGLGVPFLITAVLLEQASTLFARWGKVTTLFSYIGGIALVLIGVLMLLGDMGLLITWGYGFFDSWGYSKLLNYL